MDPQAITPFTALPVKFADLFILSAALKSTMLIVGARYFERSRYIGIILGSSNGGWRATAIIGLPNKTLATWPDSVRRIVAASSVKVTRWESRASVEGPA
jgi:hypothetical protein